MMNKKKVLRTLWQAMIAFGLLFMVLESCRDFSVPPDIGRQHDNRFPETRLGNIPVNDDSGKFIQSIPQQTFYWVGDDPDGFVIGYRFWWTDSSSAGMSTTDTSTILNITTVAGTSIYPLILVRGTPASLFRIYNFLATLSQDVETDRAIKDRIIDSLRIGRAFPVPYRTGPVAGDSLIAGDSVSIEAPTKATFIFASEDSTNKHRFVVQAVDNNDAVDPTPAYVHFWTEQLEIPRAFILSLPSRGGWVLREPTETSPGLTFAFGAIDPSTSERVFSWIVDDTVESFSNQNHQWSDWSPQASALVSAKNFRYLSSDTHTIYVRVKNKWGVISPPSRALFTRPTATTVGYRDTFFIATVPPIDTIGHPKRTLIINNNRIADTTAVKDFYIEVMDSLGMTGRFDIWTTAAQPNNSYEIPSREVLAQYTSILYSFEHRLPPIIFILDYRRRLTVVRQLRLIEYLNIGGKLIYSGTPKIGEPNSSFAVSAIENYDGWAEPVFHVVSQSQVPYRENEGLDFSGAKGLIGYPNVRLDSMKVPSDSSFCIRNIAVNYPRGFGQQIFAFDSRTDNPGFENQPVGIRYLAPAAPPGQRQTYSVVFFGFPLYYGNKSDAIEVLRKAFQDTNE